MKILAIKAAPEGFPGWISLMVEGKDKPVLVHWNWFAERIEKGLPSLETGQEVEFETITRGAEYDFVRNFKVKE